MTTSRLSTCSFKSCLMLLLLLTACYRKPVYPTMLTEADSAYVQGDYSLADSLLAVFDGQEDEAVRAYHQYLGLTQKYVRDRLTDQDFSLADSLARLYNKRGTREKHARTLLFLGDIYRFSGDNPSALNCYLQAEALAKQTASLIHDAWAIQAIGDVYFDQRMLDDCKAYYRRFYQIAEARHDTLRMAHASQRMGRVYTIEDNVDSTIFYYVQATTLGNTIGRNDFATYSNSRLADIYIQIKEYDKAAGLMEKDSMNMYNWACYYYDQHIVDSAAYYLQQSLGLYNIQVDVECLEMLADMYSKDGAYRLSNEYYAQLSKAEDSLKVISQEEETWRINAQYNYNKIKQERDSLSERQRRTLFSLGGLGALFLFFTVLTVIYIKCYRKRKERELMRERLFRQQEERQLKQSTLQIEENKRRIASLQSSLKEAQQRNDQLEANRLKVETELLSLKNQQIENARQQERLKLGEFVKSDLYCKLKPSDKSTPQKLNEAEWLQLANTIDDIYDQFTSRLTALAKFSADDLKVCYLIKIGVQPADIASLLFVSKSAITQKRTRMWKKLKGEAGSATQFDEFIWAF